MLLRTFAAFTFSMALLAQTENSAPEAPANFVVAPGTRIPLSLINSVSTKTAAEGDRIYLETAFPILVEQRIVIPPGSYVAGTVTAVKRPGRIKGRGELYIRFDSLTFANGTTRDFRSRVGAIDGSATEELDQAEGRIRSGGNKGGDAQRVGEGAAAGASVGAISGSIAGRAGMGVGVGAAAGAAAALMGVMLTRGPDAVLSKGSTIEMVLDRPLTYEAAELDTSAPRRPSVGRASTPPAPKSQGIPLPGRRLPL
jgi:hypothetical protein